MTELPQVATSSPVVSLRSQRVMLVLLLPAAALLAASLAGQVLKYGFNHDHVFGLVNLFDVDGEMNLPTWYSAATLLLAAALLAIIGRVHSVRRDGDARYWFGLAVLFLCVSTDEASFIHELLNPALRQTRFLPALLFSGWVIPGMALTVVVATLYAGFVRRLSPAVRRWFVLAAILYLGGALGVEMASAAHAFHYGRANLAYAVWTTVEEALEMAGVAVFVYALLRQLETEGPVAFRIGD
ncbi:MAG: hypothetical protein EHM24_15250 [Acidobacteria bacterium]|nr:MAG: hypothetical protein EHM24_15250 [Acidobacteriota bacterium]